MIFDFRAFPSWEMQKVGDCRAFQFVQSFEIEPEAGWMWLPDNSDKGRRCPPKITVLNLKNGNEILRQYSFPSSVASKSSFLNDIALDISDPTNKFAFISDSNLGRIIIYSFALNKSWKAEHGAMKADRNANFFHFLVPPRGASRIIDDNNVNGIAVTSAASGSKKLFFSPLTSFNFFEIPTEILENPDLITKANLDQYITTHSGGTIIIMFVLFKKKKDFSGKGKKPR